MFWKPKQLNYQRSPSLPKHNGYVGTFGYGSCNAYSPCFLPPHNPHVGWLRHAPKTHHPFKVESSQPCQQEDDISWDPLLTWGCRRLGEYLDLQDSPKPRLSRNFFLAT